MNRSERATLERDLSAAENSLFRAREIAQNAAAKIDARANTAGIDLRTDDVLSTLVEREETAKANLDAATEKRDALMRKLAGVPQAPVLNGHDELAASGVERRGVGVGFNRTQIDAARAHLLGDNPGPIRLGPALSPDIQAATQTSGDWAEAGITSFDLSRVWPFLREQPRIADIFPVDSISTKSRTYFRFLTAADQAAVVAEGGTKPQSSPQTEEVVVTPSVVAHYGAFTRQMLMNADSFLDMYIAEFVAGLSLTVDQQLVAGTGSGQLHGIKATSGVLTYVRDTTNETRIDAILGAITKVRTTAFREPTHLLIHPTDLESVRKEKASTGGLYLADPTASLYQHGLPDALWGLNVVATTSVAQATAIVIDPVSYGQIVLRLPVVAEIDPYSLFTTNSYQLRAETMLDLVAIRPSAACLVEDL
jgi:HK97 family phage major capsid protein